MLRSEKGLTFPELLMATLIILSVFVSTMLVFLKCMKLNELTQNISTATLAVRQRMTLIEQGTFNQISMTYNNATFTVPGLNGIGVQYVFVDNNQPDLLRVTAIFSWRQKDGQIIGEDLNLNGQLNTGEDKNANGRLDSAVSLTTLIYNTQG